MILCAAKLVPFLYKPIVEAGFNSKTRIGKFGGKTQVKKISLKYFPKELVLENCPIFRYNDWMIQNKGQSGHLHPLSQMIWQAAKIFNEMGFYIAAGPEIEDEWHNFDALNVPAGHPAREMQDTFWLKPTAGKKLLRTHMTSVSLRELTKRQLPLRVVSPGRVFRNEATDATHEAQFYQFDALAIDRPGKITMAELKGTLEYFYKGIFGQSIKMRMRASFFPFVEPGVEVDIKWGDKWLEVCGAGLLHPNVFKAAGLDPTAWQGLAFGSTIDRLAIIKYGINDIRLFYSGDNRLLDQF